MEDFQRLTCQQILFIIYSTLRAHYYPPTIPQLREKLERSEDSSKTAQDIHELIEQHGTHGWIDALIEKAGPTVQLQLEDMADLLEVLKRYVHALDALLCDDAPASF